MALENQPLFQAPSLPKMGKDSSPLMKGAKNIGVSFTKPKLKASKMSFVRAKKAQTIKAEDLKGQETVSTTSLASTLSETNRILVEIQNQLAIDFANRIAERKAVIKASKLGVRKKKLVEKEDFVERGKGFLGNIKEFGKKVLSPLSNIFDKIKNFLLLVGGGILLNNAWEWLSKKENRERLIAVLTFLKNHWKTIVGLIVGVKLLGAVRKLIKLVKSLRNLLRGIKPPRTGTGGSKTPFDCNAMWKCFTSGAAIPFAVMSAIALGVFELFKNGGLFPEFQGVFNPNKGKQEPGTTLASNQQPVSPEPSATTAPPIIPVSSTAPLSFSGGYQPKPMFGEGGSFFNHPMLDPEFYAKEFNLFNPESSLSVYGPMVTGMGGGFGTPMMGSVANASSRFGMLQRFPFLSRLPGFAPRSAMRPQSPMRPQSVLPPRSPMRPQSPLPPRSPLTSAARVSKTGADELVEQMVNKLMKQDNIPKDIARQIVEDSLERTLKGSTRTGADVLRDLTQGGKFSSNIDDIDDVIQMLEQVAKGTAKRSQGGTIPGRGPQNVDSVPALLAPGEEVIRASAANMFRPVLKDINSNAGRLFGEFRSGVEQQKTDLSLQRDTTQKSIGILSDFKEFIEDFTNRLKIEKAKRDVELFRDIFRSVNDTSEDSSVKTSPIPEISQQTFTPSAGFTAPSFTPQESQDQSLNFDQMPLMKYIRAQEQKPKPIDQSLRRRNTTSTTEAQVATATLPMQTIQLQPDPMPMKEQPQEYAEEKIEIQPMDMSNPYIPFTLNNYNLD